MSLDIRTDIDDVVWDNYVANHYCGHHEQTSLYAKNRENYDYYLRRIGVYENDQLVAGVQLLIQNKPFIGKTAFIYQGPIVSDQNNDVINALFDAVDYLLNSIGAKRVSVINYSDSKRWPTILKEHGFSENRYRWHPGNTIQIPLKLDNKTILAGMHKKCRYNLRLAQRKDVYPVRGGLDDIKAFYQLQKITSKRQDFPIFNIEYFEYLWKLFSPSNKMKLFFAYFDDIPIACIIVMVVGKTAYYMWGGLSDKYTNKMANYITHWEAIQWAREIGCEYYDFVGVGGDDGVSRFKKQWGGEIVKFPDSYNKYYGILGWIRKIGFELSWDNSLLNKITRKVIYRIYKPMPY